MTEDEKGLYIMREQRDSFNKLYGSFIERTDKHYNNVLAGIKDEKDVFFHFKVQSRLEIDANEFIDSLKKEATVNCVNIEFDENKNLYTSTGVLTGLSSSQFNKYLYFQTLGMLNYFCSEHFCKLVLHQIKYKVKS